MTIWKEQRGHDGSYQAVPVRVRERNSETGQITWRTHALPEPTAPIAGIEPPNPFFTPLLTFSVGVLVGASAMGVALVVGLHYLSALPH